MTGTGQRTVLKRDLFGSVCRVDEPGSAAGAVPARRLVERDTAAARWWVRRVAVALARRECRALLALRAVRGIPRLVTWDGVRLQRTWLDGQPMQHAQPRHSEYFREALRLLRRLHAAGVVHNDLAKEPNWLVTPDGRPALIDFQLAMRPRYRGRRFRAMAYDDLRHMLKHKRMYCPDRLTPRQRAILARPSVISALWARTGKPLYRGFTRGLLGWADREGAGDRQA